MSNFNKLYQTILEDEIFKASTPEEGIRRKKEYFNMMIKELVDSGKATKNPNGSYDVDGHVKFSHLSLKEIPIRFNNVHGDFRCCVNALTSLMNSPVIVDGSFLCDNNNLKSLKGSPDRVERSFVCSYNELTTLEGGPGHVGEDFVCEYNHLSNLKGSPRIVRGNFYCENNDLTSLEGIPEIIHGNLTCYRNKKKFTVDDVLLVCKVERLIRV